MREAEPLPSTKASATAICEMPRIMLLQTLAAWPSPAPPQCTMRRPIASSSGSASAKSSSEPPTMKASVAFSAPTTPPDTGASRLRCPAASASACACCASSTAIVEESMKSVPGLADGEQPGLSSEPR